MCVNTADPEYVLLYQFGAVFSRIDTNLPEKSDRSDCGMLKENYTINFQYKLNKGCTRQG